jgi:hypothetical protein
MQFFVLEINWSYSHSSNCHLHYGEVQILVSPPFLYCYFPLSKPFPPTSLSFMQSVPLKQLSVKPKSVTFRSKAVRPRQVSAKSKTVQLKSKTVSHSKKSCSIPTKPQSSELHIRCTSIGCDARHNLGSPTNSSHSISIPDSDKTLPLPTPMQQSLDWCVSMSKLSQCRRWNSTSSQWIRHNQPVVDIVSSDH